MDQEICYHKMMTDYTTGEVVCSVCGFIKEDRIVDDENPSTIAYTPEEYQNRQTGPPPTLQIYDRGLSTTMGSVGGRNKQMYNRLKTIDHRTGSKQTASMTKALLFLNSIKSRLSLPDFVVENAAYLYRKAIKAGLTKGRKTESLILAVVYISCRQHGIPRPLSDLADEGGMKQKILSRDVRAVANKLDINISQYDTSLFITKICNDLGLSEVITRKALELLQQSNERFISAGKNPLSQAAACVYIACDLNGLHITQRKVSEASTISDVTIRNRVSEIRKVLKIG